jgi:hypothetical protein
MIRLPNEQSSPAARKLLKLIEVVSKARHGVPCCDTGSFRHPPKTVNC